MVVECPICSKVLNNEEICSYCGTNINEDIFTDFTSFQKLKNSFSGTFGKGLSKNDKKDLNEMIELLGLENRKSHLPSQLSGGEQQRVSIGRALITRPSLILADEPTGNLDSKASEEIVSLLKKTNKKYNQTIIMITHNLEIAKMTDRIITIEDGRIVDDK